MKLNLNDTPVKLIKNIAPPGLAGLDFIEKKKLITEMQKDEPKIIYDTMRPVGDEFWNHIDGIKTLKTIAENICLILPIHKILDEINEKSNRVA